MKLLELFSGTHSIGKVAKKKGYDVVSVDRDLGSKCPFGSGYESDIHHQEDIMTWNYKIYPPHHFKVITASPVCMWWSVLRKSWINRVCKKIRPDGEPVSRQDIDDDIDRYGKPMVDKVMEIIDYFKPEYYWIENPDGSDMKHYITKPYYVVDYCKYGLPYRKRTRIWTNIEDFEPLKCKYDCEFSTIIKKADGTYRKLHNNAMGTILCWNKVSGKKMEKNSGQTLLERYRVPELLVEALLDNCFEITS